MSEIKAGDIKKGDTIAWFKKPPSSGWYCNEYMVKSVEDYPIIYIACDFSYKVDSDYKRFAESAEVDISNLGDYTIFSRVDMLKHLNFVKNWCDDLKKDDFFIVHTNNYAHYLNPPFFQEQNNIS